MKYLRVIICVVTALSVSACGALSATTLRCGVDGESSYVEIASAPQQLSRSTRALAELCGFAYDSEARQAGVSGAVE